MILAGNGRTKECEALGYATMPCEVLYGWTEREARAYAIRDNLTATLGTWDVPELSRQLGTTARALELGFSSERLAELRVQLEPLKTPDLRPPTVVPPDEDEKPAKPAKPKDRYADGKPGKLTEVYGTPPFSVLDANRGSWRKRKAEWYELLERGVGRSSDLVIDGGGQALADAKTGALTRTSIFDPVLCELLVRWFSAPGAHVLDPFAGGPERGVVTAKLGRCYTGVEIRREQAEANRQQAESLAIPQMMPPPPGGCCWLTADAREQLPLLNYSADMVIGCPPYYDLEVYSDLSGDLSNAPDYDDFLVGYYEVIRKVAGRLEDDRFACWVVGEIRDDRGFMRDFVSDTIRAFTSCGLELYNSAVLVTLAGTLGLRVGNYMKASRKLGPQHQNVLVFVKGDPKKATEWCGEVGPSAVL